MKCPKCFYEDTKVLESRLNQDGRSIRRRRSCLKCNYRFTTYEKEEEFIFQVKKKEGHIEPYLREKAFKSIQTACQKRPVTIEDIDALLLNIERKLQDEGDRTIPTTRIGDLILESLHSLDKVAYVRFASVYKDFKDTDEFMAALTILKTKTAHLQNEIEK